MGITVLSLFDGISCGRIALERANIDVDKYYASEIENTAIAITQFNYPDTIQLGDVNNIDFSKYTGKIDLLIGGSPCTNLSLVGKREGLCGEQSKLFYKFVEALEVVKPNYFLLENNWGMPKDALEEISRLMGCFPVLIDSARVSAQRRRRYYWTNIGKQRRGLVGLPTSAVTQPEDLGLVIRDVYEPTEKHLGYSSYLEKRLNMLCKNKGYCPVLWNAYDNLVLSWDGKSNAQTTFCDSRTSSAAILSFVLDEEGTFIIKDGNMLLDNPYPIDLPDGKYVCCSQNVATCERLQTLPVGYTQSGLDGDVVLAMSDRARYKSIGNGWTVDVIAHIFRKLRK